LDYDPTLGVQALSEMLKAMVLMMGEHSKETLLMPHAASHLLHLARVSGNAECEMEMMSCVSKAWSMSGSHCVY
jgi:hypothetical protein